MKTIRKNTIATPKIYFEVEVHPKRLYKMSSNTSVNNDNKLESTLVIYTDLTSSGGTS